MILEPAYRKLHKLKEMATEENVSPKIRAEIDAIIDLLKVSDAIFLIHQYQQYLHTWMKMKGEREKRDMGGKPSIYLVFRSLNFDFIKI